MNSARKPANITPIDRLGVIFYSLDTSWRFTYINMKAEEFFGKPRKFLLGKNIWEEFPQLIGTEPYKKLYKALRTQRGVHYKTYSLIFHRWVEVSVYPSPEGLSLLCNDISKSKQLEEEL